MDMVFLLRRGYWEAKRRQCAAKDVKGKKMPSNEVNKLTCLSFQPECGDSRYSLTSFSQASCYGSQHVGTCGELTHCFKRKLFLL